MLKFRVNVIKTSSYSRLLCKEKLVYRESQNYPTPIITFWKTQSLRTHFDTSCFLGNFKRFLTHFRWAAIPPPLTRPLKMGCWWLFNAFTNHVIINFEGYTNTIRRICLKPFCDSNSKWRPRSSVYFIFPELVELLLHKGRYNLIDCNVLKNTYIRIQKTTAKIT